MRRVATYHVIHGGDHLSEQRASLWFCQAALVGDLGEELSSAGVLHHDMQLGQRLHHLVQPDDVGVVHLLHAGDLPGQQALRLLVQFRLVQNFDGDLFCREKYTNLYSISNTLCTLWPVSRKLV